MIFEFSRFDSADYARGSEFVAALDAFLGRLPKDWPYGVEMRNKTWLNAEYFACLARHKVTHVLNSWTAMPSIAEQMALPGSVTSPDLVAARFLLKPGCTYENAVKSFQPYRETREINLEGRKAGAALVVAGLKQPKAKRFVYVNNRFEGTAPETIAAMFGEASRSPEWREASLPLQDTPK